MTRDSSNQTRLRFLLCLGMIHSPLFCDCYRLFRLSCALQNVVKCETASCSLSGLLCHRLDRFGAHCETSCKSGVQSTALFQGVSASVWQEWGVCAVLLCCQLKVSTPHCVFHRDRLISSHSSRERSGRRDMSLGVGWQLEKSE